MLLFHLLLFHLIDHLAPQMTDGDVCFLNARRAIRGDRDGEVAHRSEWIGRRPRQSDRATAEFPRPLRCFQYVLRSSAGADGDQNIARLRETCELAREHLFVTEIVADCRQSGRVGRQGDRGPRTALFFVTADKFGRNMLRISRAAAVTAKQNLLSGGECVADHLA